MARPARPKTYRVFVELDPYEHWVLRVVTSAIKVTSGRKKAPAPGRVIGAVLRSYYEFLKKHSDPDFFYELEKRMPSPVSFRGLDIKMPPTRKANGEGAESPRRPGKT